MQPPTHQLLLDRLKAAFGLLELEPHHPLRQEVLAVCDNLDRLNFRIAVFAPFNYGKSTLLNALLGERALPMDLIPTTGAAITVRYAEALQTRIQFTDGRQVQEPGTEILKQFAVLDGDRRMRQDVAAVEVCCPHPFLQRGVELVDLPGTDDREAQDLLVKDQLLTADLIVQVLDGRKLMTLGEREHLRDWLQDRGIETVVFVVNFLNLLEPEDQKQVYQRLRFVAESFRSRLPAGVSNLYRVDALPALRARLKGDGAAAQATGLPIFESALQQIVQTDREKLEARLPRIRQLAGQVEQALVAKTAQVRAELAAAAAKREQKIQIKQQATQLIRQGFSKSVADFQAWLSLANLLDRYQEPLIAALLEGNFRAWETGEFKKMAIDHQQAVARWVQQACDFFDRPRPAQLLIKFPPAPAGPGQPETTGMPPSKAADLTPTAIATTLGLVLGGPVGGAILGGASFLLNKSLDPKQPAPAASRGPQADYLCLEAAREYLINFSSLNLATLQQYETVAERVIQFQPMDEPAQPMHQQYQVQLIESALEELRAALKP